MISVIMMPRLSKDALVNSDSDIDEIEPGKVGKVAAMSSVKSVLHGRGTK